MPSATVAAWQHYDLRPSVLRGAGMPDSSVVLPDSVHRGGAVLRTPVMISPTAGHGLVHPDGESATARAAAEHGALMIYSNSATVEVTQFGADATGPWWAQLYLQNDRARSWDYLDRAKAAGAGAIVLTVDLAPAAAATFRKTVQNQLTSIPGNFPDLTWAQMSASFAPGLTADDVAEVVARTGLPVHVKGVLQAADAHRAIDAGAAGIVVSNSRSPTVGRGDPGRPRAPDDQLSGLGERAFITVDGGIRSGSDVVRALALGARLVGVGRPIVWGVAADGSAGAGERARRSGRRDQAGDGGDGRDHHRRPQPRSRASDLVAVAAPGSPPPRGRCDTLNHVRMQFSSGPDPMDLLTLPWSTPLEEWPSEILVSLPRGISRHVVRFARIGGIVYAIKEINQRLAEHEYETLRILAREGVPVVEAVGVVANRTTPEGEPLDAALVTKHLRFSLPYRALFSRRLDPDLEPKLLDALAELLVRLHLAGFAWNDCSLSNTLFRRDAGALAAYLVDAETGEIRPELSSGQRAADLDIAEMNLAGELLDLQMSGWLPETVDPVDTALSVVARYQRLWRELTQPQTMGEDEWWRIEQRLRRLNEMGYDVARLDINEVDGNSHVMVQTQVVEAGHHRRRLLDLTGLDVGENQARRILNDLDTFRSQAVLPETQVDEDTVARHWMSDVFEPVIDAIPAQLAEKLEPAEVFHEVLEHRWFLSEAAGREVSMDEATTSYMTTVLPFRPDEQAVLEPDLLGLGMLDAVDDDDPADAAQTAERRDPAWVPPVP